MMPQIRKRVERSPFDVILPNGDRLASEVTYTSYDDWRDTIVGPVNFGRAHISTRSFIEPAGKKPGAEG